LTQKSTKSDVGSKTFAKDNEHTHDMILTTLTNPTERTDGCAVSKMWTAKDSSSHAGSSNTGNEVNGQLAPMDIKLPCMV